MGAEDQIAVPEPVRQDRRKDVCVLTIDNPPSGALSAEVRRRLIAALDTAKADNDIKAVVIAGQGAHFATGGSASEHAVPNAPSLADLCDRIEASAKPVVVAIAGAALGGGLEVALAAHARVATAGARLGAPDITIGLVPNAGGTQRLPKVIGGIAALKLLLSGRSVNGSSAAKLGLVDVLAKDDVVGAAVQHARSLARSEGDLRRSSTRRDRLGEGTAFLEAVAMHRAAANAAPLDAPIRMIECVEAALLLPYAIGRGMEQAAFDDLVNSEHSKSLRHIFAAERTLQAASNWTGRVESRKLTHVAIVGASGISIDLVVQCLDVGFHVTIADLDDTTLEAGTGRIIGHYEARITTGAMTEEGVEDVLDRMHAVSGYQTLVEADLIVDPSPSLTKTRMSQLDAAMKAGSVLLLGGEKMDVATVASVTSRPSDIVGMRFYPGLRKNRLIELSAADVTGPKAVATARAFARKIDRLIIETSAAREAVGTRIMEALHAAADICLEEGATVAQIDVALKDWGLPFGSFAWRDVIGINRGSLTQGSEGERGGGIDAVLISTGRLGLSTGRGYYIYRERGKPGVEDPEIAAMVDADRAAKAITPSRLTDGQIKSRCVAAMAGAAAQMVTEGMVRRPADVDMVAVHGLGFARRTGGVMYAADLIGLNIIQKNLFEMSKISGRVAPPPSLLQDLMNAQQGFGDLN
ncbi:MAG: enoyl-CoA hydratase-related protein [Pseudomonadota bacterium]